MAPLVALIGGTLLLRAAGLLGVDVLDSWPHALRGGVALMFTLTGVVHFVRPWRTGMIAMVPPRLPRPGLLVTVTGVLEVAGAVGVLVPWTARVAGACLALLLVAMFPANVHAARSGLELAGKKATPLPRRTAEQLLYVAATVAIAAGWG